MMLIFTLFATGMWLLSAYGESKAWSKYQKSRDEIELLLEHIRVLEGHIEHLNRNLEE